MMMLLMRVELVDDQNDDVYDPLDEKDYGFEVKIKTVVVLKNDDERRLWMTSIILRKIMMMVKMMKMMMMMMMMMILIMRKDDCCRMKIEPDFELKQTLISSIKFK